MFICTSVCDCIQLDESNRDRTSTCDAPHLGRPIEAATPEIIESPRLLFWLIEWKCASLLKPQVYHMAQ